MDALWQDVRYALRTLGRSPGFTIVGVLVLAIAIAVNTAIFSLVNALIFVPLPVPNAHELRFIYPFDPNEPRPNYVLPAKHREFDALRKGHPGLANIAGYGNDSISIINGGEHVRLRGESVTPNYFEVLGIQPQLGRFFTEDDHDAGAEPTVVISDRLWKSRYQGSSAVTGQLLEFDLLGMEMSGVLRSYRIIGVTPPAFTGVANRFQPAEFWTPRTLRLLDNEQARLFRAPQFKRPAEAIGDLFVQIFFRKPPGVSDAELSSAVETMARQFARDRMPRERTWTLQVHKTKRNRVPFDSAGRIVPTRLAAGLMIIAGAVALIALANLTGILSARSLTRRSEMAVRTTLGAGAWRLCRQLLVESVVLVSLGGVVGLVAARALVSVSTANVPRLTGSSWTSPLLIDVPLDWRVLTFTFVTCAVAAAIIAIAPVRQALSRDLLAGLSDGHTSATGRSRTRLRELVLLPQVSGSLVLLVMAGLLVRGMLKEEFATTGYEAGDVVMLDYHIERYFYYRLTPEQRTAAFERMETTQRRLLNAIREVPDAVVALTYALPGGLPFPASGGDVVDRETFGSDSVRHGTLATYVTAGFFETLRIPIKHGRSFSVQDRKDSPKVAIVSEGLAWRIWRTPNAVGRYLARRMEGDTRPPQWMEVVGVAADLSLPLTEGARTSILYVPAEQQSLMATTTVIARGASDPVVLLDRLKDAVLRADPKAVVAQPRLMADALDAVLFPRRAAAALLGMSGLAGLLLACIGLYGVVSYSVAQRVREIGIRTALGAERRDIMRMILRDGARVIALGSAIGGLLAFAAIRLTSAKVVALPQADALAIAVAPLVLAIAMLAATYIPARRAASVDPMIALRRL